MFHSSDKSSLTRTLLTFLLAGLVATTAFGQSALVKDCGDVIRLELETSYRMVGLGRTAVFEVDALESGVLVLEAATPLGEPHKARLALFDTSCRPVAKPAGLLARYVSGMVVEVPSPGTYRFAVALEDGPHPGGELTVTTRFRNLASFCGYATKTQAVAEPDPDLLSACLSKTQAVAEPDPDLYKTQAVAEPDPDLLSSWLTVSCPRSDDHGDLFGCATPVGFGTRLTAGLDRDWNDDTDVFTFVASGQRTFRILVEGDPELRAALFDEHGQELGFASKDAGSDLRITKTLAPGRYYVRVEGRSELGSAYTLSVSPVGW